MDLPGARAELPAPPRYGQHTRAVLADAGYDDAEIGALMAARVVA